MLSFDNITSELKPEKFVTVMDIATGEVIPSTTFNPASVDLGLYGAAVYQHRDGRLMRRYDAEYTDAYLDKRQFEKGEASDSGMFTAVLGDGEWRIGIIGRYAAIKMRVTDQVSDTETYLLDKVDVPHYIELAPNERVFLSSEYGLLFAAIVNGFGVVTWFATIGEGYDEDEDGNAQ